jgi:glycosyltransferase involved in cell wall biosynthesis
MQVYLSHRPKLLIVLNYFHPYISGVSEYARWNGAATCAEFETTVLTGRHLASLPSEDTIDGLHVVRAEPLFHLHKGYISWDFVSKFIDLAAKADVINLHLPMLEGGLFAKMGSRYAPVMVTYHCDVTPTGGIVDWLAVESVLLSGRIAAKHADVISALTRDYASGSRIIGSFTNKLVEIPPIMKMEAFERKAARQNEVFNLGFVGRFVKEKGIDVILDAVGPIISQIPNAKFLLVGETRDVAGGSIYGSLTEKLARWASHIEVLGHLSDARLWEVYNEMDVLLLPSVNSYEGFGMVQIEAMLAGSLVVTSDMRGVRIPVKLTGNGYLARAGDVGSLVEAVMACRSLRQQRSREEVRARTLEHYSNHSVQNLLVATFKGLIEERRKRAVRRADKSLSAQN